jgi:hypothetical protein
MANEFSHNSVGPSCTQAEFEAIGLHKFNNQATGDMLTVDANGNHVRLPVGENGERPQATGNNVTYAPGGLIAFSSYTSGSGNHSKNVFTTKMLVHGVGGGGGGGGSRANNAGTAGGGGGSGAMFRRFIISPNDSYAYAVGAGGGGGANSGANGSAGGNTTFDAGGTQNLLAPGGAGGSGQNLANNSVQKVLRPGNGGALATGNGSVAGDVFCQGSPGRQAGGGAPTSSCGGAGGSGWMHDAGKGGNANGANANESGSEGRIGSGGGGGATASNAPGTLRNANGGNGGNGIILIWEWS